ncbi:hypothetical protein TeGR_g2201 [Tetraparma gracilis]|uniref:Serine carboxypeptidase n=1 Tax=Tetraparma gracilis TaxID=2962635 RepID=A0ABQ6MW32_9STRA|nr:hypothetical protein TeGR_g2201 [Tetraparma gracilis]
MTPLIPLLLLASSLPLALAKRVPPSSDTPATPDPPSRPQPQPPARSLSSSTPPSPDSYLVTSLPGLAPSAFPTPHFAGHISVTPGSFSASDPDRFFSWFFHPSAPSGAPLSEIPADTPLLIWLNGGPACSSMDGLWLENGPFRLSGAEPPSIAVNEHSWHRAPAYALYVDQPVGTGLSFTTHAKYPRSDAEVNEDFYGFLLNFLKIHSLEAAPVFFAGESHAGHYIPSMIADIRRRNAAGAEVQIDVRGAAIGNGWFDPRSQYDVSGFA